MKPKDDFTVLVLRTVSRIPAGRVMTYGDVAKSAGRPAAARAVGNVMKANHDPAVPCHRVVRRDGVPGGYNRGAARKVVLLKEEGVTFTRGRIDPVNMQPQR